MTVAYGFIGLTDLFNQRVQAVGPARVYDAVNASAAEYTRVVNALLSEFAERTIDAQIQFELPGDGSLQPLDADGNPLPVLPSGSYTVAFPIQGAGTAWGTNRITRALMTVEESNRATLDALQKDADWNTRHLLPPCSITWLIPTLTKQVQTEARAWVRSASNRWRTPTAYCMRARAE